MGGARPGWGRFDVMTSLALLAAMVPGVGFGSLGFEVMGQGAAAAPVRAPEPKREFRAVWVATVANIDWPSRPGLPVAELKREMVAILDRVEELNMNAVIFQVRPHADALYKSEIEPWSWYLTGEQGRAPEGGFDPLQFTIEEAHRRGLELHVWCNPYRAGHGAMRGPIHSSHIARTNPDVVHPYGTFLWMDPGEKLVQDRSYAVFMDLVERYDIDGLHIDDYFYPYPVTENGQKVDFPDSRSWARYQASGGTLSRGDWRRKNVDDFVERIYRGVKERKPWVKFGISPFGIYRPGIPAGIRAGVDQYAELYADALKWYREGWADYFTPQLYWPIAQTPQAFPVLLDWWASQNSQGIHFWPGQFTSRTNPSDGNWKATEVSDQIALVRKNPVATGTVHFSMRPLMLNWNGITDELRRTYAEEALVPATPWLKSPPPGQVSARVVERSGGLVLDGGAAEAFASRFYVVQDRQGRQRVSSELGAVQVRRASATDWVSVRAMDRSGNLGEAFVIPAVRLAGG